MSSYICHITYLTDITRLPLILNLNFAFMIIRVILPVIKGVQVNRLRVYHVLGCPVNRVSKVKAKKIFRDKNIKKLFKKHVPNSGSMPTRWSDASILKNHFWISHFVKTPERKISFFFRRNLKISKIRNSGPSPTVPPSFIFDLRDTLLFQNEWNVYKPMVNSGN